VENKICHAMNATLGQLNLENLFFRLKFPNMQPNERLVWQNFIMQKMGVTMESASLTLRILKSLYPQDNLDAAGEGFAATYSDDEGLKLIEDSIVTVKRIIDMLPVDMSLW
jgi:hypothetical protein